MKIEIEVPTWHLAHYLAGSLADTAYNYRKYGYEKQAKFFDQTARVITKAAEPLNWKLWDERKSVLPTP